MSKEYRITPTHQFLQDFDQLTPQIQRQVLRAVEMIKRQPEHGQLLRNKEIGCQKWRVGEYRIRYDIQGDEIKLHIVRHRASFRV